MFHLAPTYTLDVPFLLTVEPEAYDLLSPEVVDDAVDDVDVDPFAPFPVDVLPSPLGWVALPRNAGPASKPTRPQRHPGVEFAIDGEREHAFKTFDEAAGFAVRLAVSHGRRVKLDVLVHSAAGANWWRGPDGVTDYNDDPEASVFERIVIHADSQVLPSAPVDGHRSSLSDGHQAPCLSAALG